MDQATASTSEVRAEAVTSASGHLRSSWEHGKEAARGVQLTATKSWNDLSGTVDSYLKARPKTAALGALGAGLVLGFVIGTLASRSRRASSGSVSEAC